MSAYADWLHAQARDRELSGLTRALRPRGRSDEPVDLAGNDYLGLSQHPRVTGAAADAARSWGAGASASRLVTGSLELHGELESALADISGASAALVLSTGYHANLAALTALADADTLIVSDAHVHASLVDGCRLARGSVRVVPHADVDAVRSALAGRTQTKALVVVESVYSVLGDAAPLSDLLAACVELDALLLVDEAHGIGVAGAAGRGLVHGLRSREGIERVVVTATLSKALGAQGGAVLAERPVVEQLVNTARPFIYDTGLAPACSAAALESLHVLAQQPDLPGRLRAHADRIARACGVPPGAGAVVSVPMSSTTAALEAAQSLLAQGVRVGCFRPPSVPDEVSRLRVTARADLRPDQLERACALLTASLTAAA
ncbi:MAG: 8-amino-7-oxononanoate synthase [Actinomycetota bacterium]|nr:8-amino-7-oxononanoate synthase [Actinomycetota bacterium]